MVINIQKEVGCNECSFCGFAFRKITGNNDIRSPLFFLFLYISLLICFMYLMSKCDYKATCSTCHVTTVVACL